jgi:hypothetical protein
MGIQTANQQAALAMRSTESANAPRMTSVASPMGLATTIPSMAPMLVGERRHSTR